MAKEKLPTWPSGWNEDLNSRLEELGNNENERLLKTLEVPQDLKDFREAWEERINNIANASKEKIIKAAEQIPVKVEIDNDGSRLVEFELWNKTYKILDPKLKTHSEDKYIYNPDCYSIKYIDNTVSLEWMLWDDVTKWKNKKLANYVQEKEKQWLKIATIEDFRWTKDKEWLLPLLWKKAKLDNEEDQIAMLMYLTWMDWCYWLKDTSTSWATRTVLTCTDDNRWFRYGEVLIPGVYSWDGLLCLIACS